MKNFLISIVAVVSSWFGVHNQIPSNQLIKTDTNQQTMTQKTDWKTYTNVSVGFSFDYPSNWSVCSNGVPDVEYVRVSDNCSVPQNQGDSFIVRTIGDADIRDLQSGVLKQDVGWKTFTGNSQMRARYYQSKNINTIAVVVVLQDKNVLDQISASFKSFSGSQPSSYRGSNPNMGGGELCPTGEAWDASLSACEPPSYRGSNPNMGAGELCPTGESWDTSASACDPSSYRGSNPNMSGGL